MLSTQAVKEVTDVTPTDWMAFLVSHVGRLPVKADYFDYRDIFTRWSAFWLPSTADAAR